MALGDLFKSKKQRQREERKKRRRASRQVRTSLDGIHSRVEELKKKRDKDWAEARNYLKDGQKNAAARCLKACRATEILMARMERKAWIWEQKVVNLEASEADVQMAGALQEMNDLMNIDPDAIADTLDDVNDSLAEQGDVDKIMEAEYEKEMDGVMTESSDSLLSLDEMEKMLEDEVAAEIGPIAGSKTREVDVETETDTDVSDKISEGRKRLKGLMEEDK